MLYTIWNLWGKIFELHELGVCRQRVFCKSAALDYMNMAALRAELRKILLETLMETKS
jgi:hypothetical protein